MLITSDGQVGTISGGCLESDVVMRSPIGDRRSQIVTGKSEK